MTMEEGYREAFLERADLPAHRGLAEVQRLAGMREAARFRHAVEDPELVPIHRRRHGVASTPLQRANGPRQPPGISPLRAPPYSPCRPPSRPGERSCLSHRPRRTRP